MKAKKIHIFSIALVLLILAAGSFVPDQTRILTYISSFGFLALLSVIFVISIPLLFRLKRNRLTTYLLANRRWIGIYTFIFTLIHVLIVMNFFFAWDLGKALSNTYRLLGGIALLILAALTATSNDTSMRKLGKNWKRLHYAVYIALLLVIVHSFNIGKIFLEGTAAKIVIIILVVVIIVWRLILRRKSTIKQSSQAN
ncbi:MAG TPA: ferric reductase-like transmembrane domain-containing protein [archaeon]|nr:ferric reductase-like transmembrane domain-containing protein [archaeon]